MKQLSRRIVYPFIKRFSLIATIAIWLICDVLQMIKLKFLVVCLLVSTAVFAQNGIIRGKIYNKINNEPIPFANVLIQGTTTGAVADNEGNYQINNLKAGQYNLEVSFVGYKPV